MTKTLSIIIDEACEELERMGFTQCTIRDQYFKYWHIMLNQIGDKVAGRADFENACVKKYGKNLMDLPLSELSVYHQRMKTKINILLLFQETGVINARPSALSPKRLIDEQSETLIDSFISQKKMLGNADTTLKGKRDRITSFVVKHPVDSLSESDILEFIASLRCHERLGARVELNIIKDFLNFLHEQNIISRSYSELFPNFRIRKDTARPSVYSPEETIIILDFYKNKDFKCSRRNYCLLLMLAHYGLRAKDVAEVKIDQIDWDAGTITVITSKTKEIVTLPLLPDVGNEIADYIIYDRPQSHDPHIFLSACGCKLAPSTVSGIAQRAICGSGIAGTNRKHGSHALRSSLATRMMNDDVPLLAISKVLSHASISTTRRYTKVDIKHLRLCELEVAENDDEI